MSELVSIVMPAYNAASTIADSINSVLAQTRSDWVLYVVDDCSTDDTALIVAEFSGKDKRVIYIKQPHNSGVAEARNAALRASAGKYIAFLDSDDIWFPEKLAEQVALLEKGYDVVATNYIRFSGHISNRLEEVKRKENFSYFDMLQQNQIGNLTGIYNQSTLGKVYQVKGGHEDYVMWLSLLRTAKTGFCIQKPLAYYRVAGSSLSGNKFRSAKWQWSVYRKNLQLGILKSTFFFSMYAIRSLLSRV